MSSSEPTKRSLPVSVEDHRSSGRPAPEDRRCRWASALEILARRAEREARAPRQDS